MIKEKRGHARQGALFAYEALFEALGKLFEPYLAQLIPDLLLCFGDSVSEVRIATQEVTTSVIIRFPQPTPTVETGYTSYYVEYYGVWC